MRDSNPYLDLGLFEILDFPANFKQPLVEVLAFEGEELAQLGHAHLIYDDVLYFVYDDRLLSGAEDTEEQLTVFARPQVLHAEVRKVTVAVLSDEKVILF